MDLALLDTDILSEVIKLRNANVTQQARRRVLRIDCRDWPRHLD